MFACFAVLIAAGAADPPKTAVGLIGQSILHYPNKSEAKDNIFDYLNRWGGGRYDLKFATASGAGMHSDIPGAEEIAGTKFDFFVMCEGTKFPLEAAGEARSVRGMGEYAAAARKAGSVPVMFVPYPHRSWYGDPRYRPERKWDANLRGGPDDLIPEARATFARIARELRLDTVPVFEAHVLAHERLKGKNLEVYYADNVHMKPDGHFLNAAVTHAVLMNLTPVQMTYPGDTSELKLATESLDIARETIRRHRAAKTPDPTKGDR